MSDERPELYVHAEAPTDDDVRCFYEIPEQLAGHIRTVAPDEPFNSALVKWLTQHQRPVVTEDMVNNAASTLCALGDWLDALSRGDTDRDYPALIAREVIRATFTAAEIANADRLREALNLALDCMKRSADDHNCDYCRSDLAAIERVMRGE